MWHTLEYEGPGTVDFSAYWSAGQLLRRGENPYDLEHLFAIEAMLGWPEPFPLVMVNPPWLLVWFFPLFLTGFRTATLAWLGANLTIALTASGLLWGIFNPRETRHGLAIAWIACIAFAPVLATLRMGQVSSLTLLGVVGFMFFARQEQDYLSGIFLALTTAKPHTVYLMWVVIIWWVFTQRRWKVLAGSFSVLSLSSLALTYMRPNWIADYHAALGNLPLYYATPTIGGILRGLAGIQTSQVQYLAPAVTGLLATGYLWRAKPSIAWKRAISPILLLSLATAPFGWTHDQIVLLVPYLQLIAWLRHESTFKATERAVVISGLALYSGALVALNLLKVGELYKFWTLWVLVGTYAYAWLRHRSAFTLDFAKVTAAPTNRGL